MADDPHKDQPSQRSGEGVADSRAEENRRKLEENLAKIQGEGFIPKAKKSSDPGSGSDKKKKEIPKPPPRPAGWDAWKRVHGGKMHQLRQVDAKQIAQEADFRLLELKPGAPPEDIKRNFNRLAKQYHPDLGGDAEIFNALRQAYNRLNKSG